jgi:hypothetical protein
VLVGLDIQMNASVLLPSVFSMADSVVKGNLMMAQGSSLFLLGTFFLGYLGCLWSHQCLRPPEGG